MFLSIQKQLRPHLDTTLKNRKQLWPHVKLIWQSSINGVPVICPLSLMLMFSLQIQCTAFRRFAPATGTEIPQLNLPAGDYAVIRYVFIPFKGNETSADFSGIIFRSDSPNTTTPWGVAASINGKDYYLFTGEYGKKASQKNIESQVIKKGLTALLQYFGNCLPVTGSSVVEPTSHMAGRGK